MQVLEFPSGVTEKVAPSNSLVPHKSKFSWSNSTFAMPTANCWHKTVKAAMLWGNLNKFNVLGSPLYLLHLFEWRSVLFAPSLLFLFCLSISVNHQHGLLTYWVVIHSCGWNPAALLHTGNLVLEEVTPVERPSSASGCVDVRFNKALLSPSWALQQDHSGPLQSHVWVLQKFYSQSSLMTSSPNR